MPLHATHDETLAAARGRQQDPALGRLDDRYAERGADSGTIPLARGPVCMRCHWPADRRIQGIDGHFCGTCAAAMTLATKVPGDATPTRRSDAASRNELHTAVAATPTREQAVEVAANKVLSGVSRLLSEMDVLFDAAGRTPQWLSSVRDALAADGVEIAVRNLWLTSDDTFACPTCAGRVTAERTDNGYDGEQGRDVVEWTARACECCGWGEQCDEADADQT